MVKWVGKKVTDCGEDSGAKYPEVLDVVAIATVDRSKSKVTAQEETLILSQPSQRTQLPQ
jgi:hypothetical protein